MDDDLKNAQRDFNAAYNSQQARHNEYTLGLKEETSVDYSTLHNADFTDPQKAFGTNPQLLSWLTLNSFGALTGMPLDLTPVLNDGMVKPDEFFAGEYIIARLLSEMGVDYELVKPYIDSKEIRGALASAIFKDDKRVNELEANPNAALSVEALMLNMSRDIFPRFEILVHKDLPDTIADLQKYKDELTKRKEYAAKLAQAINLNPNEISDRLQEIKNTYPNSNIRFGYFELNKLKIEDSRQEEFIKMRLQSVRKAVDDFKTTVRSQESAARGKSFFQSFTRREKKPTPLNEADLEELIWLQEYAFEGRTPERFINQATPVIERFDNLLSTIESSRSKAQKIKNELEKLVVSLNNNPLQVSELLGSEG